MAHKISIYYNESTIRDFMKGAKIQKTEQEIMQRKLSQIEAEFLQTFGFQGKFDLKAATTNSRRSRITYRVEASNSRTGEALKRQPGWLAKFAE